MSSFTLRVSYTPRKRARSLNSCSDTIPPQLRNNIWNSAGNNIQIYKNLQVKGAVTKRKSITEKSIYPYKQFINEYFSLQESFPEFPSIMLQTLVIREKGNMDAVYRFLVSRGWKSIQGKLFLSNTKNILFSIPYFWGVDKPEYLRNLKKQEEGSFFVVFSPPTYLIYFKTSNEIKKQQIPTPDIQALPKSDRILLTKPLPRPHFISDCNLLGFPFTTFL